jgi:phospholipase/carboxylesterase
MEPSAPREIDGFVYRTVGRGSLTIIALHGAGADELTMLPLAAMIDPHARVFSIRGRVDQNGERRWFRKITPTSFDQDSIREEVSAFAGLLAQLERREGIDRRRALYLGYSNGGNLAHSTMLLHPGLITRTALLRTMPVLRPAPQVDLAGAKTLVVRGAEDATYGPFAPKLVGLLRRRGASASLRTVAADHMFGADDAAAIADWLRRSIQK